MNRTLKTVFLVSLIANVLLLGVVLGALPRRIEDRASFRDRFKADLQKLPEPARTRFRETIDQAHKADEPVQAEIRAAREEALRIIAAEPFDAAAYDRQVDKISDLRRGMFKRMADKVKGVVKDLPPDQRKALAEILKRPPPGPPA